MGDRRPPGVSCDDFKGGSNDVDRMQGPKISLNDLLFYQPFLLRAFFQHFKSSSINMNQRFPKIYETAIEYIASGHQTHTKGRQKQLRGEARPSTREAKTGRSLSAESKGEGSVR